MAVRQHEVVQVQEGANEVVRSFVDIHMRGIEIGAVTVRCGRGVLRVQRSLIVNCNAGAAGRSNHTLRWRSAGAVDVVGSPIPGKAIRLEEGVYIALVETCIGGQGDRGDCGRTGRVVMHVAAVAEPLQAVPVISLGSEDVPGVGIAVCEAGSPRAQAAGERSANSVRALAGLAVAVRRDALGKDWAGNIIRAFRLSGFGHASVEPIDAVESHHGVNDSVQVGGQDWVAIVGKVNLISYLVAIDVDAEGPL